MPNDLTVWKPLDNPVSSFTDGLLDRLGTPVWVFDIERCAMVWANQAALPLWQAPDRDELLARDFSDRAEVAATRLTDYLEAFRRGQDLTEEWTLHPRGRPVILRCRCSGVPLPDGRLGMLVEVVATVTAKRAAESLPPNEQKVRLERLERLERQLLTAISSISEGFLLFDEEDRLVLVNEQFKSFYPLVRDVMVPGVRFQQILELAFDRQQYAYAGAEQMTQFAARMTEHLEPSSRPFLQHLADGRVVQSMERRTPDGGVVGIVSDITELIRTQEALRAAKDRAEAGERAKAEFLATMSHEIRTPMNGVIGMTGLLLDTPLSSDQRHFAGSIRDCAESLLTIINDILDFSKMEAGKLALEVTDFSLLTEVESVLEIVASRAYAKGLELVSFVPATLQRLLLGDPGRLRQILLNLVGNAVKFTESGSVSIQVSDVTDADGRVVVRFEVRDTGIGIPPEARDRLFQEFSQVDASTARKYGGTGLGLAISRRLVDLMGGSIGVESEPDLGSTFWIAIPFTPSDQINTEPEYDPLAFDGKRVLVVDDTPVNRDVFVRQLAAWRFDAEAVSGAAEALVALRGATRAGRRFDLLLLDHNMPGMTGLDLAAVVRADPDLKNLPILFSSSSFSQDVSDRLSHLGLVTFVHKPVRQSALLPKLAELFGPATAAPQSAASRPDAPQSAALGPAALGPAAFRPAAPEALPIAAGTRLRILVAEDNVVNQQVAAGILGKLGHRVDVAGNGREAVEAVRTLPYDLVFMDVQMPEMDGYEATTIIRRLSGSRSHVPIIAMTANAMEGDRAKCLSAGMDDYVPKPIDRRKLEVLVEHWMSRIQPCGPQPGCAPGEPAGLNGLTTYDPSLADLPLVDVDALGDLVSFLGADKVRELVQSFRRDAATRVITILDAVTTGPLDDTIPRVHGLVGVAGNLGLRRLAHVARAIEEALKRGDVELARKLAPTFSDCQAETDRLLACHYDNPAKAIP